MMGEGPQPYYEDDSCVIYHGDCREILADLLCLPCGGRGERSSWVMAVGADVAGECPDCEGTGGWPDVMVTDPPYGISHTQRGFNGARIGRSIVNDEDTKSRDVMLEVWQDRPALVFGSPLEPVPEARQALVWHKGAAAGLIGATKGWRRDWEAIYLTGIWPKVEPQDSSVLRYEADLHGAKRHGHSHLKPLGLMRRLLEKCPEEWTILDPFMGSGTTLRAAKDLGRKAIGIEIEERYCEIAAQRLGQEVLDLGAA